MRTNIILLAFSISIFMGVNSMLVTDPNSILDIWRSTSTPSTTTPPVYAATTTTSLCSNTPSQCPTISGEDPNNNCTFPFRDINSDTGEFELFYTCTQNGGFATPYCATEVDTSNGCHIVRHKWGYCDMDNSNCQPTSSSTSTISSPTSTPTSTTSTTTSSTSTTEPPTEPPTDAPTDACQDFTVGDCHISSEMITWESDKFTPVQCQGALQTSSALLFRHDGTICYLLNQNYRKSKSCDTTGAPVEVVVGDCEDVVLKTCNGFFEEDCSYTGEDLGMSHTDGHFSTALECQQYCRDFHGCKYWVFNQAHLSCHLHGSGERSCAGISGPKEPSIDECNIM